jgi:hypothetical protein
MAWMVARRQHRLAAQPGAWAKLVKDRCREQHAGPQLGGRGAASLRGRNTAAKTGCGATRASRAGSSRTSRSHTSPGSGPPWIRRVGREVVPGVELLDQRHRNPRRRRAIPAPTIRRRRPAHPPAGSASPSGQRPLHCDLSSPLCSPQDHPLSRPAQQARFRCQVWHGVSTPICRRRARRAPRLKRMSASDRRGIRLQVLRTSAGRVVASTAPATMARAHEGGSACPQLTGLKLGPTSNACSRVAGRRVARTRHHSASGAARRARYVQGGGWVSRRS